MTPRRRSEGTRPDHRPGGQENEPYRWMAPIKTGKTAALGGVALVQKATVVSIVRSTAGKGGPGRGMSEGRSQHAALVVG
jgi:hypothetical protein